MTTYQRPGVYISETLQPIVDPSISSSDSIAAFVGVSSGGGPIGPTLVTSWSQYQSLFGSLNKTQDPMGFAAYLFFANGGSSAYISRALNSGATAASASFSDIVAGVTIPAPVLNAPVLNVSLAAPAIGTATPNTTGGTLSAGQYFYVVTATNSHGETLKSGEVNATTTGSTGSVVVTWSAVAGATGYKVYKGTTTGTEGTYFTVSGGSTVTFTDTGAAGTSGSVPSVNSTAGGNLGVGSYFYVVTAVNGNGETIGSNEVSVTVPAATTTTVNLGWGAVPGATKYKVYRGATTGGESVYYTVNSGTTFADTGASSTPGTVPTTNSATTPSSVEPVLQVSATSPGTWASAIAGTSAVYVTINAVADGNFDFIIDVGPNGTTAHEVFSDVSLNPLSPRYIVNIVNSATIGSNYVNVTNLSTSGQVFGVDYANPAAAIAVPLVGGADGTGSPDVVTAVERLQTVPNNLMVNIPGWSDVTTLNQIITWVAQTPIRNMFFVVDAPQPAPGDTATTTLNNALTLVGSSGLQATSRVAVYAPWIWIQDPSTNVAGAVRLVAPGGAVLGKYAQNDVTRSVAHAPAGTGTALNGVVSAYVAFPPSARDSLNTAGVNVITSVAGVSGVCLMGARTLSPGMPDRYISTRRTLMYLEKNIHNIALGYLFEQNTQTTWDAITNRLNQFLLTQYQLGVVQGTSASTAFTVVCDNAINTPQTVNAGQLNVQVGVSIGTPAEYIVINVGLINGGPTTITSTSN